MEDLRIRKNIRKNIFSAAPLKCYFIHGSNN